jgi:hypothetical protein
MPLQKIQLRPGIVRDTTNYSNEGGWFECDKIRFFSGFPQKIGGWVKTSPLSFIGVCRQLWNWITSFSDNFLAVGTNIKVYIEAGSVFYDITPLRTTLVSPATDNCVETTSGSTTVTINVVGHGCDDGAYVTISGVTGMSVVFPMLKLMLSIKLPGLITTALRSQLRRQRPQR